MRIQTGKVITLGYGRFVRSDEIVAVEPVEEGRGPGRRCLVWVRGVADPIVASRSEMSIIRDMIAPEEAPRGGASTRARASTDGRTARASRGSRRPRAAAARSHRAAPKKPTRRR